MLYSVGIIIIAWLTVVAIVVVKSFVIPSTPTKSVGFQRFNTYNNRLIQSLWMTTGSPLQHHHQQRQQQHNNNNLQFKRFNNYYDDPSRKLSKSTTNLLLSTKNYDEYQVAFVNDYEKSDIVIVGGGPAGLLSAIMMAQKFGSSSSSSSTGSDDEPPPPPLKRRRIMVIDRLNEPAGPDDETVWNDIAKFYLIGLGGRGQKALQTFGVWDAVQRRCIPVVGRKDWSPNDPNPVERIFDPSTKRVTTQILPRDKLVSVLYEYIQQYHSNDIEFLHGYEVEPTDFFYNDSTEVLIQVTKCLPINELDYKFNSQTGANTKQDIIPQEQCDIQTARYITTKLLIGADGTVRTIANSIEEDDQRAYKNLNMFQKLIQRPKQFYVKRYVDDNQRLYKSIPFKVPIDWRGDLNYSARTAGGGINFDALPANNRGDYCGILLVKYNDPLVATTTTAGAGDGDGSNKGIVTSTELRTRMNNDLPQFSKLIDDTTIEAVATKPISQLPSFRYVTPRLHHGNNCVILGDCIHTVKPYFGLGANSALEDVKILSEVLDGTNINLDDSTSIGTSIRAFTKRHAKDTKTLVRLSRELDRPGQLGLVTFLLPIILDGIFSSMVPKLFHPNTITMLQREDLTFRQVARIKRRDRIIQGLVLGGTIYGITKITTLIVSYIAKLLGVRAGILGTTLFITTALSSYALQAIQQKTKNQRSSTTNNNTTSTGEEIEEKTITVTSSQQTFVKPVFSKR